MVVWAPADVSHGVVNTGTGSLVLLVGIAPFPAGS
jgi:quercetin dioxygenase-like cupin family protein